VGDQPQQVIGEAHLGLARVLYEWNDLTAAEQHARRAVALARQYEPHIDRHIIAEVFLSRLKLAQGDLTGAAAILAAAEQEVRQRNFVLRAPEVAAAQVLVLLRQGRMAEAAELAQAQALPLSQARAHLAQGNPAAALAGLDAHHQQAEARGWRDEALKALALQALALQALGEAPRAGRALAEALALAEPGGFIRLFVDEGPAMAKLLKRMKTEGGRLKDFIDRLLAAFGESDLAEPSPLGLPPLVDALTPRELEILRLVAQGLSNQEISGRLFLALSTVKGHVQRIFEKLQVQRRTEAVARARELGLL
jgi:LuxR family maltose regulon positive regulatory protein